MISNNFYESLSDEILSNEQFIQEYKQILSLEFKDSSPKLELGAIKRLIESAAIMACSNKDDHKKIAYRIASFFVENEETKSKIGPATELVFLRLGNFPAVQMSIESYGLDDFFNIWNGEIIRKLPPSLAYEIAVKTISNHIQIGQTPEYLTDFQADVLHLLRDGKDVSLSAPTSAGKSFLLKRYIVERLKNSDRFTVVYIVPTRALISQIQNEFRKALTKYEVHGTEILTSSWQVVGEGKVSFSKAIIIVTQERLHNIEGNSLEPFSTNLLIVDEAQKIEEGSRGIILEESIQQLLEWNPKAQVVFISPFTENPEKLDSIFERKERIVPLRTSTSPVGQNLIRVDIDKKKVEISLTSPELKTRVPVRTFNVEMKIPDTYKKKAWVATEIVETGSTMVYCNGPDDCRKTANIIAENLKTIELLPGIQEAIRFLKKEIHPEYFLIDYLQRGVGYHYGNMPSSVRKIVENLFSIKQIDTICCTSTLMEGVNFPAKNIVIYKPKTGSDTPMEELSFLNLAGRAGRLLKDFYGNIYCVDIDSWEGYKPEFQTGSHRIRSSMEDVVTQKKEKIISHLQSYFRLNEKDKDVGAAVTRFIVNEIRRGNKEFVGQLLKRDTSITQQDLDQIIDHVKEIVKNTKLPGNIILKNRLIDPRLQNTLYLTLKDMSRPPIPLHPNASGFYESFNEILKIINKSFYMGKGDRSTYLSFLAMSWVSENTLGEIISRRIKHNLSNNPTKREINKEIEDCIKDINGSLQFEMTRDLSCYIEVLKQVFDERKRTYNLVENLPYFLELGAYKPTTITLLNNGISRTPAIIASRILPPNIQDLNECKKHIKENAERLKEELPHILFEELSL